MGCFSCWFEIGYVSYHLEVEGCDLDYNAFAMGAFYIISLASPKLHKEVLMDMIICIQASPSGSDTLLDESRDQNGTTS